MKNAMEIAKIAKTAQKNMETARRDFTMKYIEEKMNKGIENAAKAGEVDYGVRVPRDVDRDLIKEVFSSHGFDVRIKGFDVKISWFIQCAKVAI
jgi:methanogenic corrinoid protein MtbC1